MPADRQLFANGFGSGETFIFDLTDPAHPRLAGQFGDVDGFSGALAIDERFRDEGASTPGFRMDDKSWSHGGNAKGIPQGAVFGRR